VSIQELGSLGELIAAIATIATLIYLAIQIKQNTRAVQSSVLEATGARSMDLAKFTAGNADLALIIQKAYSGDRNLEESERARLSMMFTAAMRSYEATVAQHANGFLDEDQFGGRRENLRVWVGAAYFDEWWNESNGFFSSDLNTLVEQLMSEQYANGASFLLKNPDEVPPKKSL